MHLFKICTFKRLIPLVIRNTRNVNHDASHTNPGPPVTMDYMPVPFKPFKVVYRQLQSKFNFYLGVSVVLFTVTLALAIADDVFKIDAILPPLSYRNRKKMQD
uniref:Deltameth_res domain-containing protein n=1 Tax=Syphacia muris TaxID=451379 RepID=A0A0N5AS71_9BILA